MKKQETFRFLGPCAVEVTDTQTGLWRYQKPIVDMEQCRQCGVCVRVCPCNVIVLNKAATPCIVIDFNFCKGCGVCAYECPFDCIQMIPQDGEQHAS